MRKDPVCGMDVHEKGARYFLQVKHETVYFCSSHCKQEYAQRCGIKTADRKKSAWTRFLEKLAQENEDTFGGKPPSCH